VAIALFMALRGRRSGKRKSDRFSDDLSTDVINMARIRVAGVGGLGLIAMAAVVAWFIPRIGQTLLIGLVLGIVLAVAMILRRRRVGPMPSSGRRPGAKAILSIDRPMTPEEKECNQNEDRNLCGAEPAGQPL
jgi:hypothetical protein